MIRTLCMTAVTCAALAAPAFADEDIAFPETNPFYPFQRSVETGHAIVIPPYRRLFPVRAYSTPQQQPYYNVPPYLVVAPY